MTKKITKETARKVLAVVDQGLVKGIGRPEPGHMCVEAAVCFALNLPHSDEPPCVSPALRALKIALNDAEWSSDAARTAGLRKLAILQLGTNEGFDEQEFAKRVAMFVGQTILADCFADLAKLPALSSHEARLNASVSALRTAKTVDELRSAADSAARSARSAARSARSAAYSAADSAGSAAYSAYSAAYSAYSAAYSARSAAYSAYSAAYSAADSAAYSARSAAGDKVLATFAEGVATILVAMGVQGAKWLGLL